MSTSVNVPIGRNQTISASGDYTLTLGLSSSVTVQRDVSTPANDPVNVVFETISAPVLSTLTVQNASVTLGGLANLGVLTTYNIGDGGLLDLSNLANINVAAPIRFTGEGGILALDHDIGLGVLSGISGFNNDDVIAFRDVAVATSARYANGVLTVFNGDSAVASVALGGTFDTTALGVQSDGHGGVHVGVGLGNGGGLSNDVFVQGLHNEYILARTDLGQLYLQDTIGGRDASTTVTDGTYVLFADGVGRFDASGIGSEVAHLYQAAFDRRPDATGLEFWINRVETGVSSEMAVATGFTQSDEFRVTYGNLDDRSYVSQLYLNVLNRAGEQTGIDSWLNLLNTGAGRDTVLYGFANSFENVNNTTSRTGDNEYGHAYRLYEAALNRAPEATGLNFWYSKLEAGESVVQIAQGFMNSDEFRTNYGGQDNDGFIRQLYLNVLGRAPDAAGFEHFQAELASGTSRAEVLVSFSDSLENRIQTAGETHDNWIFLGA
ncbi:DUF4214 domain-containing protein [Roseomonas haemaphysalidis]|uniref:DUF4214 domain-containing protein n=1 Tax=Roseomonas haemaphysalidis TaxID=2768162 RepID=A0ABS3KM19_9PROT|nr:DUF4214 domain-containing protein [Roseomonas haemaphysalidis]MBO1078495.1 DUF4214 domain-containing protein [Roseomonas haemaphysalidis]